MKTTLIVSSRGVVTLPAKFRAACGIGADDHIIAETTGDGILLRPAVTLAVEMYSAARVREFDTAEADLAAAMLKKKPARTVAKQGRKLSPRKSIRSR